MLKQKSLNTFYRNIFSSLYFQRFYVLADFIELIHTFIWSSSSIYMIQNLIISSVINSKKQKSLKLTLKTDKGYFSASIPSGTSTGKHEVSEFSIYKIKKNLPK